MVVIRWHVRRLPRFRYFEQDNILDNVNIVGEYLYERLEDVKNRYPQIVDHRGIGLIQGLEFDAPVGSVIGKCLITGLLLLLQDLMLSDLFRLL